MMEKNIATSQTLKCGQYEYLLVAHPDAQVLHKVMIEKQVFLERYKESGAIASRPFIIVAKFMAEETMENTAIRWIERICSRQRCFNAELNNFSGFPPHSIYMRIQNPKPFEQLSEQLQVIGDFIKSDINAPVRQLNKPHLTIANRLTEDVYSKAMMDYSHRDFHTSFMVNELVLLKRKQILDDCEKVMVFRFLPAEVDLFSATA